MSPDICIACPHADQAIKLGVTGRYSKQQLLLPGDNDDFLVLGLSASRSPHKILFGDAHNKRLNALDRQSGGVRTLFTSDWYICAVRWVRSARVVAILERQGRGMQGMRD